MTEKKNLGGEALCEESVTIEVSTDMGGKVILAGKTHREDHMVAQGLVLSWVWEPRKIKKNVVNETIPKVD